MDFALGILGMAQITLLPGLVLHKLFKWTGTLLEKLTVIFGLSLIANYCVLFLLSIPGLYNRTSLGILILAETAVLLWLYRAELVTSLDDVFSSAWNGILDIMDAFLPKRDSAASLPARYLTLFLGLFSLVEIAWAAKLLLDNLGTIFSAWDAVVSWDRWAEVWASGRIPLDSFYYPQLIPLNWSIPYVLMGNTFLQFFGKGIMPIFTLLTLLEYFDLYLESKNPSHLLGLIFTALLLQTFIGNGLTNGYVDIASAFFAFTSIYLLLKSQHTSEPAQQFSHLLLGAVFTAGAAVAKQPGVYIALCYPALALYLLFTRTDPSQRVARIKQFIYYFAAISLIWVSWYAFKEIRILTGLDRSNLDTLISLSQNEYDKPSFFAQVFAAMGQFGPHLLLFAATVIAFPFMDRFHKFLTALVAPYPILWAWMASYDTRNLAFFLPLLGLLAGYSVHLLAAKTGSIKLPRIPIFIPLILALAGLFYVNTWVTPERLFERQDTLQRGIFSPIKNQMIYDIVAAEGPQVRILTNYPMDYLPDLAEYKVKFNFEDYDVFLAELEDPNVKYILMPNGASREIKDHVNANIETGEYELIARNTEWKVYTLIRIVDR